jgi:excisionase family DNA binding protein
MTRAPRPAAGQYTYTDANRVATRLGLSKRMVYYLIDQGDIKAVKFGRSVRIIEQSVDDYEAAALAAAGVASLRRTEEGAATQP